MSTVTPASPQIAPASDRSLLVRFADEISVNAHRKVMQLLRVLRAEPAAGIYNIHPAYSSLLVTFDPLATDSSALEHMLRNCLARAEKTAVTTPYHVEIPVCYGGAFGPDLEVVAQIHSMTSAQVIELHACAEYVAYFLGFVPGFAYLGGLPPALATPRLATPRRCVPAGSVGIAADQTAVYPFATPGGWRLIGRTPLILFRPHRQQMSLISIGDRVRFRPISADEFARLASE
jgi:inhibitor of KinA